MGEFLKRKRWWLLAIVLLPIVALVLSYYLVSLWPVKSIKLKGHYTYVREAELEDALKDAVPQNMFYFSMDEFKSALESIPWIKSATIRRLWPDTLLVYFEEYVPFAQWCYSGYLSREGQLIPSDVVNDQRAHVDKRMCGPDGTEQSVLNQYLLFNKMLAPLGLNIHITRLTERYSWDLYLSNKLLIKLGRENVSERLARLIAHWKSLERIIPAAAVVDLRYPNGIAVRGQREEDRSQT